MSTPEVRPLTRMRRITTIVIVSTVGFVGALGLIFAGGPWWHVALVLPALAVALWVARRWSDPPPTPQLYGAFAFTWATWALAVVVRADIPAAVPLATVGSVIVATRRSSRPGYAVGVVAVVAGTSLLSLPLHPDVTLAYLAGAVFYTAVFIPTFWLNDFAWKLFTELDAMRKTEAELAVIKERMRFASDVHDIQGHTLHVIKLKAAVAAKLQHTDPDRVAAELAEIERLTAETIEQAQHLANSTRTLSFTAELANASALLTAARMTVDIREDGPRPADDDEVFALVLREATTNILRHPRASTVTIEIAADALAVTNDGAGETARTESGLARLRETVARNGGALDVRHDGDAFSLVLTRRAAA